MLDVTVSPARIALYLLGLAATVVVVVVISGSAATVVVGSADGAPGEELQLDTGWVGWLTLIGHKRRFRAWIFTAVRSRHRFVYPTFEETTARAIEACEAAWEFESSSPHRVRLRLRGVTSNETW